MSHKTLVGTRVGKVWGDTQCLFVSPYTETHYLNIKKGGFCSLHCHEHKWNRFVLIKGKLTISILKDSCVDSITLEAGQITDVPPGDYHQFKALEDCECIEIYWVDRLETGDITRKSNGGIDADV